MSTYLVIQNNNETKKYPCDSSADHPFLKVSNSYLPLVTDTTSGLGVKIKIDSKTYRPLGYVNTTTSVYDETKTQYTINTTITAYSYDTVAWLGQSSTGTTKSFLSSKTTGNDDNDGGMAYITVHRYENAGTYNNATFSIGTYFKDIITKTITDAKNFSGMQISKSFKGSYSSTTSYTIEHTESSPSGSLDPYLWHGIATYTSASSSKLSRYVNIFHTGTGSVSRTYRDSGSFTYTASITQDFDPAKNQYTDITTTNSFQYAFDARRVPRLSLESNSSETYVTRYLQTGSMSISSHNNGFTTRTSSNATYSIPVRSQVTITSTTTSTYSVGVMTQEWVGMETVSSPNKFTNYFQTANKSLLGVTVINSDNSVYPYYHSRSITLGGQSNYEAQNFIRSNILNKIDENNNVSVTYSHSFSYRNSTNTIVTERLSVSTTYDSIQNNRLINFSFTTLTSYFSSETDTFMYNNLSQSSYQSVTISQTAKFNEILTSGYDINLSTTKNICFSNSYIFSFLGFNANSLKTSMGFNTNYLADRAFVAGSMSLYYTTHNLVKSNSSNDTCSIPIISTYKDTKSITTTAREMFTTMSVDPFTITVSSDISTGMATYSGWKSLYSMDSLGTSTTHSYSYQLRHAMSSFNPEPSPLTFSHKSSMSAGIEGKITTVSYFTMPGEPIQSVSITGTANMSIYNTANAAYNISNVMFETRYFDSSLYSKNTTMISDFDENLQDPNSPAFVFWNSKYNPDILVRVKCPMTTDVQTYSSSESSNVQTAFSRTYYTSRTLYTRIGTYTEYSTYTDLSYNTYRTITYI